MSEVASEGQEALLHGGAPGSGAPSGERNGMYREALAKLRRGGEQVVRVEHVHVHPGGQAIVGNIAQQAPGGVYRENEAQPHAQPEPAALAYAPGTPLWSQDAPREAVPVASREREETLPDARRGERIGSTDWKAKR